MGLSKTSNLTRQEGSNGVHQLKKISLYRFLLIVVLESASSNFILPVTPTIIKNLNLPDSLFGLSYAGMSLSCFLFAPFWAKISNKIGRVNVYATGCIGYALAQVMFCFSTTYALIMAARIISGVFIGAINVIHLAYLIDISSKDDVGKKCYNHVDAGFRLLHVRLPGGRSYGRLFHILDLYVPDPDTGGLRCGSLCICQRCIRL